MIHRTLLFSCIAGWALSAHLATAAGPIEGYADYVSFAAQVQQLRSLENTTVESLGTTLGGREIFAITVSRGVAKDKPAVLIVGGVEPSHLVGSELALRLAKQIATSDAWRTNLERYTFHIIPRVSPDATEACLRPPYVERSFNERPTDDDRDGEVNEDGVEDLNGDGWITMLRVEDASGDYLPHPADARVMILADPTKNEKGRYRLLSEGVDNDHDEQWNEDGPGGVAFNRNFTFQYPYFQAGAGPHQISDIETRAIADFTFAHRNIAVVFSFTPEDNLMHPWKSDPGSEGARIKTAILKGDAPYLEYLAKQYQTVHGGKEPPASPKGAGSFSDWAYFHFGRWSLAAKAWWLPKAPAKPVDGKPAENKPNDAGGEQNKPEGKAEEQRREELAPDDPRGADEINALRWFAQEGVAGFVDWQPIEHPDFPGKRVEIGGFKPFLRTNPPAKDLDALAEKHVDFLQRVVAAMPTLQIDDVKVEPLGDELFRVTTTIANHGFLPTAAAIGKLSDELVEPQVAIELPKGASLVTGHPRHSIEQPLSGSGGKMSVGWLVRRSGNETTAMLRVWCPTIGKDERKVELQ